MMCPVTDNPVSCESHAEIHRELCVVYSQDIMSEGKVRQWSEMFMMKSEVVGCL
jgi:hypothetical protein